MQLVSIFKATVLTGVIIAPLNGAFEAYELVMGSIVDTRTAVAPVYVKVLKDLIFLTMFILGVFASFKFLWGWPRLALAALLFCVLSVTILMSLSQDLIYIAVGLRWSLPILVIPLIFKLVDHDLLIKMSSIVIKIFWLQLALQLVQVFIFTPTYFGMVNNFLIQARMPGMFFIPNTAGFFAMLVLYLQLFVVDQTKYLNYKIILASFVSGYLTGSGTALMVWFAFVLLYTTKRLSLGAILMPFFALIMAAFLSLEFISGRGEGYIQTSLGIRFNVFLDLLLGSTIISETFGKGTATVYLMGLEGIVTDSTFSALLANTGYLGYSIFMLVFVSAVFLSLVKGDIAFFALICLLFPYLSTSGVTEAYPMNLVISVVLAFLLKDGIQKRRSASNSLK